MNSLAKNWVKMNNSNRQAEPSGTITLGDVYFVIFRHK